MMKPSRHSSVASAFFRATPLRLALPALALVAAFGLFVSGCGDDSPTTPTPAPTPTPTPPTPPAPPEVPTGLAVASVGPDYIEWTWTAVEDAASYDIQMTTTENDFSESQLRNIVAPATSARFTVAAETQAWARVRAKTADAESDYSDAVSGTSDKMPLVLTAPTGLREGDTGPRFIEWTWNVVAGATAYEVQVRPNNANFAQSDRIHNVAATAAPKFRHTVEPETSHYVRVRAIAGTGADRVEGPWALAVEGESEQQPLGVPTGLEVSATGQDFIEATWDAVEGATGYTVQLDISPPYNFSPTSRQTEATTTRHRFTGLASGRTAHVRVRATRGSDRGEYSDPVVTATEEPPVVPIGTPTSLTATGATRTQVTINWPDVTRAVTYEVQQRVGSSGNWGDATCDESDDNEVTDSVCTATGLTNGTEYEFRVRAVPVDDDDDLFRESAWSTPVSATTTGRAVTGGGSGDLNVRWRSTQTEITWQWDQAPSGEDFEIKLLAGVQDVDRPCETRADTTTQFANSLSRSTKLGSGAGNLDPSDTLLLCVRTTTIEGGETETGDWSHSWAVTAPMNPGDPASNAHEALTEDGEDATLEAISLEVGILRWSVTYSTQPQFDYEFAYIVDELDKSDDNFQDPTSNAADQRACSAAELTETTTPGGATTPVVFESSVDLIPFANYRMCYRALNDNGRSEWAYDFVEGNTRYTRPAPPASVNGGSVTGNRDSTGNAQGTTHFKIEWEITVSSTDAPKVDMTAAEIRNDYEYTVLRTQGASAGQRAAADDVRDRCNGANPGPANVGGWPAHSPLNVERISDTRFRGTHLFEYSQQFNNDTSARYYYLCARTKNVTGNNNRGGGVSTYTISPGVQHRNRTN